LTTPNTISAPTPPPTNKTIKLAKIPALFDSLDTFVTKEGTSEENVEAFGADPLAKPSRVEKLAFRALRFSTKTHKIVCVLVKWTINVHALGLAIDPPVFDDPSVFESEPSFDY